MNNEPIKKLLVKTIKEAGGYASAHFGKVGARDVHYKEPNGKAPVTPVDLEIDHMIKDRVWKQFPEHDFISEESESVNRESKVIWIIDPIDGTGNYIRGNKNYNVSIGISIHGRIDLGAVYAPELDELYVCERGAGLYLNDRKVEKMPKTNICLVGRPSQVPSVQKNPLLQGVETKFLGAAALELAKVAAGEADCAAYSDIMIWDMAAGSLMVEEVGGRLMNWKGEPFTTFMERDLIAKRI